MFSETLSIEWHFDASYSMHITKCGSLLFEVLDCVFWSIRLRPQKLRYLNSYFEGSRARGRFHL